MGLVSETASLFIIQKLIHLYQHLGMRDIRKMATVRHVIEGFNKMTLQKRPNRGKKKGLKKPIPKQGKYPDPEPNIKKPKDEIWVDPTPTREL